MNKYDPVMSFDEHAAATYDASQRFSKTPSRRDRDAAVRHLGELARGGPALELAIGTGWIALPLAATGVRVDGIDISPAMIEQLRAKPGSDQLTIAVGDMADITVSGSYRLIYVVANSLFNVLTQDEQVRCFQSVARHLADDGVFLIEAYSPASFYRRPGDQYVHAEAVEVDLVRLDVAQHDPVNQLLVESHVTISRDGVQLNPIVTRYAWPSELDLMARIAGLRLKERWDDWHRTPYTAAGSTVISIYGPASP
jgi:ubiquinone/menaquinone biosynthesis C-methylase UbiE